MNRLTVVARGLDHPEGVCLDANGDLWTGGEAGQVYRVSTATGKATVVAQLPGQVLGLAVDSLGACVCCTRHGVYRVEESGGIELLGRTVDGQTIDTPNYPAFGPDGRLYVSESGQVDSPTGRILVYTGPEFEVLHSGPFHYANGIAFDAAGEMLYVVETLRDRLVQIDLFGERNREPIPVPTSRPLASMPDGVVLDEEGGLYVTSYADDCVERIGPSGDVRVVAVDRRALLLNRVTNAAFAHPPSTTLYMANLGGDMITAVDVGVLGLRLFTGSVASGVTR